MNTECINQGGYRVYFQAPEIPFIEVPDKIEADKFTGLIKHFNLTLQINDVKRQLVNIARSVSTPSSPSNDRAEQVVTQQVPSRRELKPVDPMPQEQTQIPIRAVVEFCFTCSFIFLCAVNTVSQNALLDWVFKPNNQNIAQVRIK